MKIKLILNEIINSMNKDINNKKWLKFLAKFTAFLAAGGCAGYAIGVFIEMLIQYRENIVLALGTLLTLFVFWVGFTADKPKTKKEVPQIQENGAVLIEYDMEHIEATYRKLRFALYDLLLDDADILKLRKPASPSQLDSPVHFDTRGVNIIIFHFLAYKAGNAECDEVIRLLEKSLEDKLSNFEIDGFQPDVICGCMSYPSIMVDSVREAGEFLQINLVIPTDEYIHHRQNQLYRRMISSQQNAFKDKDF